MQRHPDVRAVDRLAPLAHLGVEHATRGHEGGHVGDGVQDPVPVPRALDEQGLVEVHGTGRVDREERHARLVACPHIRSGGCRPSGLEHLDPELLRHVERATDVPKGLVQTYRRRGSWERPADRGRRPSHLLATLGPDGKASPVQRSASQPEGGP